MNKQQRGMTLIELMISMVISLGLIAGISSLFLQMQKSNKMQRGISAMADDSSYVQEVLQKEVRNAGRLRSRSDVNGTKDRIFLDPPGNTLIPLEDPSGTVSLSDKGINLLQAQAIKGDTTSPTNDLFVIRYQLMDRFDLSRTHTPSNGSSPCTQNILMDDTDEITPGNPVQDPELVAQTVSVAFFLNGTKLSCSAQRQKIKDFATNTSECMKNCKTPGSTTDFTPDSSPAIDVIDNVIRLLLVYGVDTDADNAANYYVSAADVPSGRWRNVVSLRMTVVVRSEEKFIRDAGVAYQLDTNNDGVLENITPTDDKHQIYKVFTTTIALRNQLM